MLVKNLLLTTLISNTFWYMVISDDNASSNAAIQTSFNLSSTFNNNNENSIWFINLYHYLLSNYLFIFFPFKFYQKLI